MKRRKLLVVTGSALSGAGCIEGTGQSNPPSTNSPTEPPTDSQPPTSTPTDSCSPPNMMILNDSSRKISVSLTITEAGSRYRGPESPTATKAENSTPEETPVETFADSFTLPVEGKKSYDEVPLNTGDHILDVTVEEGPEGSREIDSGMLVNTKYILVGIDAEKVRISSAIYDGC